MKVSIIVGGRFHAFDLAEQLHKKNCLKKLITSYPKKYVKNNFNIATDNIISLPLKEILFRSFKKVKFIEEHFDIDLITSKLFAKKASKLTNFSDTNILVGWSSFSLYSFEQSKKYNCINILERGSTHIEFQRDILREEYDLLGIKPNLPSQKLIEIEKKEYELSDYICVPSEFAKKTFLKKGYDENKVVKNIYGVDLSKFNIHGKVETKNKFNIICVGSLSVRKGVIYLIKAFNELKLKNSNLIFVGDVEKKLDKILSQKLNDRIKIFKSVNQNLLKNFYINSSVCVTCSVEEGLSMVQLQAMACGLPVICTENSGGREIIDDGENGFILPIRDVEKLKEKLKYLYDNQDLMYSMGKKAEKKAKSFLDWDNYGSKMINFYSSLLK